MAQPMNIEMIPLRVLISTYISFLVLIIVGHMRDLFVRIFYPKSFAHLKRQNKMEPIYTDFESFFTRRLYTRIRDCWNRPITGVPGTIMTIYERKSLDENVSFTFTGKKIKALNVSSYNYLGLATNNGSLFEKVIQTALESVINVPAPTRDVGKHHLVADLEREMATFVGKEDCAVFSMGFGTNSGNLPVLISEGCLVLSDELNHTSIIYGLKMSSAVVKTFMHNSMEDLEHKLRTLIAEGQPSTHRQWKRVFVIVEGIYSMEGSIAKLKEIVELKRKYKFVLFVDEAHSIGALGKTGRGICEHLGVDPADVDILMGTFTKSFGGSGGYIAGSSKLIKFLRAYSDFALFGEQLAPVIAAQVLYCLRYIKANGKELSAQLMNNTKYFRAQLIRRGYIVFGDCESPVVPLMIFNPAKIASFSRMCLERKVAVVVVGYPATPVISSRVRFCVSAAHSRHDIDKVLRVVDYVGKYLGLNIVNKKD